MTVSTCSTNNSEIIGTILNSRTPHIARNKEWVKWSTNPQKFNCISFLMTRSSKKKQFGKSKSDQRPCLDKAEDEKDPIVNNRDSLTCWDREHCSRDFWASVGCLIWDEWIRSIATVIHGTEYCSSRLRILLLLWLRFMKSEKLDRIVKPLNHATSFAVQAENKINNFLLSCPPQASAQSVPRMHHLEIFTLQFVLPL